jgi:hypothetical protein
LNAKQVARNLSRVSRSRLPHSSPFGSPSGCPPPVGGAPSRHTGTWEVHAAGVRRGGRPGGAPKQAAEAMPSSRRDARAAGRAGGAHRWGEEPDQSPR